MKFTLLLLVFSTLQAGCQRLNPIQIELLNASLTLNKKEHKMLIQFDCKNKSDSTLLLYGINRNPRSLSYIKAYDLYKFLDKMSADCALYIYDSTMKVRGTYTLLHDKIGHKLMTHERIDSIMTLAKINYLKDTRVINGL